MPTSRCNDYLNPVFSKIVTQYSFGIQFIHTRECFGMNLFCKLITVLLPFTALSSYFPVGIARCQSGQWNGNSDKLFRPNGTIVTLLTKLLSTFFLIYNLWYSCYTSKFYFRILSAWSHSYRSLRYVSLGVYVRIPGAGEWWKVSWCSLKYLVGHYEIMKVGMDGTLAWSSGVLCS